MIELNTSVKKKNMQALWNFNFVLKEAKYDYFVWAAADDLWGETFLEKNMKYLENDEEYVGSISNVIKYGENLKNFESNENDNIIQKEYKKIRKYFRPFEICPIIGNHHERIKKFLKNPSALIIYGLFRTKYLKKSVSAKNFLAADFMIILNILEYGNIVVLDEVLLEYYAGGSSSKGLIYQFKNEQIPLIDVILPYFNFLNFLRKKYGIKFILFNTRCYMLFLGGIISNIREIFFK
jgi:hypothetical protein